MRTITFYSYKGGVGRSLLVANAARYLSTLGKRVFALDLDLEAPGLHYKFELGQNSARPHPMVGLVDILTDFLDCGALTRSLDAYVSSISVPKEAGVIQLMRSGTAPQGDYWEKLSHVNWHDLFFGESPQGVLFFLELKERIRRDFAPDFLLIDARTGMTEMGAVASTLMSDIVVCLALASIEHLDGLRAIMQGIQRTRSHFDANSASVTLVPVISRLSVKKDAGFEEHELDNVRLFLNEPLAEGSTGLNVDEVMVLHGEPLLEMDEQLLVGSNKSPYEAPLLRDYLRLFSKVIPAEDIRPHVGELIQRAISGLLDDPDSAQSALEALTTYCADEEAFRALLKLYQVRKAPIEKLLATAALMWQIGAHSSDSQQLLWNIVSVAYSEPRAADALKKYANFAEAMWRSSGMKDVRVGITIANVLLPEHRSSAIRLLTDYLDKADPPDSAAVVKLIDLLRSSGMPKTALTIVERFKGTIESPEFQAAWARAVLTLKDTTVARQTIEDRQFRADAVRLEDPSTLYRLLKTSGASGKNDVLIDWLEEALSKGNLRPLRDIAFTMYEEGRFDEFRARAVGHVPAEFVEDLQAELKRRKRWRYATELGTPMT